MLGQNRSHSHQEKRVPSTSEAARLQPLRSVTVNDFIQLRQKDWQRLETLIRKHPGRVPLGAKEVRELGMLYRAVSSDLALARRDYGGQRVITYLNQLLTSTHSYIYQQETADFRQFARYFTRTLPATFRQTWKFTLAAFLMFIIPALAAFSLTTNNPALADTLGLQQERQTLADHDTWTNIPANQRPYASAFIMSNNIRVAIYAFGGGVALGLFSVYVLAMNGISVGGVLGLAAHYGMGQSLIGFMAAHGVIELSVIFIASGAGLQLGWALINPGPYSRLDAMSMAAQRALTLVIAAFPLLVIAGTIEGFLSPTNVAFTVHLGVGLVTGLLLYAYLLLMGRSRTASPENR